MTEEEIDEEDEDDDNDDVEYEDELVSADGSISNESATLDKLANVDTQNAFKSNANGSSVVVDGGSSGGGGDKSDTSMHSTKLNATIQPNKQNHLNIDNDVICVLVNGQPTQFTANTPINLSTKMNTETLSHSYNTVNENDFNKSPFIDKLPKVVSDKISSVNSNSNSNSNRNSSNSHIKNNSNSNSSCNAYERKSSNESMQQQQQKHPPKYSDDAMHLPDIVVGSTLSVSNANSGAKKPIPLSRSPPKIIVNDQTLDSWTSTEEETGTFTDSIDESIEVDGEEAPDLSDVSVLHH